MRTFLFQLFPLIAMALPIAAGEDPGLGDLPPGMTRATTPAAPRQTSSIPSPSAAGIPRFTIPPVKAPPASRPAPARNPVLSALASSGIPSASPSSSHLPKFRIPTTNLIWPPLVAVLFILLLVKLASSPLTKGWIGEMMVIRGLRKLDPTLYQHHHDIYLPRPDGKGSTQIDHIVVSRFGIFVIETKNYKGWIFGSEKQAQWTQQIYRSKHRFQNPLHQNHLHVKALMQFLGLQENRFRSLVFFIGGAEFKTPMPANVLDRGLLPWISGQTSTLVGPHTVEMANSRLDTLNRTTNRKQASRDHLIAMRVRNA